MRTMVTTLSFFWLTASSILAQEAPKDDPLIFAKRLNQWTQLLTDESLGVRYRAARFLGRIGPQAHAAVPALIQTLDDPSKSVRHYAARALGDIGRQAKTAVPALTVALTDKDLRVRSSAAYALGQIGPEAKNALPKLKEQRLTTWSAYALVQIDLDDEIGIPFLIEKLNNNLQKPKNVGNDSRSVMIALGRIGPRAKAAMPALKEMLKSKYFSYRTRAAYAVARIDLDDKTGFETLLTMLDTTKFESCVAARMLGSMGPEAKAAVPFIIGVIHAGDKRKDSHYYPQALGNIGVDAKTALPILRKLATHSNQKVREAAALAIYKIEPP